MRKFIFLTFMLVMASCQTVTKRSDIILPAEAELLFPFATYQQKIKVTRSDQENTFDGVLVSLKDSMGVYAFGPLGAKVFTLKEKYKTNEISFETPMEIIADKKDFIYKLYPAIKRIFLIKKSEYEKSSEFDMKLEFPLSTVHIKINHKDKNQYEVSIKKEGHFTFIVTNN